MSNLIEKAIEWLNIYSSHKTKETDIFIAGYELCQKEYEEKLRWILVEEKLPENRERVLVKVLRSDKSTIIVTGSVVLDSKLGVYWQSGHSTQRNVTHWLSLSFL